MDNRNVIDIFVNRGMVDASLGEDMLHEIDASGKDIGEILTDERSHPSEPMIVDEEPNLMACVFEGGANGGHLYLHRGSSTRNP